MQHSKHERKVYKVESTLLAKSTSMLSVDYLIQESQW